MARNYATEEMYRLRVVESYPNGTERVDLIGPYEKLATARSQRSARLNPRNRKFYGAALAITIERAEVQWESVE
jgi:hypothetical protein